MAANYTAGKWIDMYHQASWQQKVIRDGILQEVISM
jgi:hypothetical protein